jgi:hypothetical protein
MIYVLVTFLFWGGPSLLRGTADDYCIYPALMQVPVTYLLECRKSLAPIWETDTCHKAMGRSLRMSETTLHMTSLELTTTCRPFFWDLGRVSIGFGFPASILGIFESNLQP